MTFRELLEQLKGYDDHRLDAEVEVYVSGEYYNEVLPVEEFIECSGGRILQLTANTQGASDG